MSTRTRVVLTYKGKFHSSGYAAVRAMMEGPIPSNQLRGMSKRAKLEKLAEKLPVHFALVLIQEPRGTRKNRSLYWAYKGNQ